MIMHSRIKRGLGSGFRGYVAIRRTTHQNSGARNRRFALNFLRKFFAGVLCQLCQQLSRIGSLGLQTSFEVQLNVYGWCKNNEFGCKLMTHDRINRKTEHKTDAGSLLQ